MNLKNVDIKMKRLEGKFAEDGCMLYNMTIGKNEFSGITLADAAKIIEEMDVEEDG